jgi:hypothetical protein
MEVNQNPFSLYDFLGYLIPGLLMFVGFVTVHSVGRFGFTLSSIELVFQSIETTLSSLSSTIVVLLVGYLAGHLVSFLSSYFLERYSQWTVGYASKYLLRFSPEGFWSGSKYITSVRMVVVLPLAPVVFLDAFLRTTGLTKTVTRPLDDQLVTAIKRKISDYTKGHFELPDTNAEPTNADRQEKDWFRFVYHYAMEAAPNHFPKMQNYVALYGFTRTMSFVFLILFWTVAWTIVFFERDWNQLKLITSTGVLSYLFYLDFQKFSRKFALEALMALATQFTEKEATP